MNQPTSQLTVVALVRDLFFVSRILHAAADAGVTLKLIRNPDHLAGEPGQLLLVDLNLPGAILAAAGWANERAVPVVGFVSHVDAQTAQAARAAGIQRILARSQFAEMLPAIFTQSSGCAVLRG